MIQVKSKAEAIEWAKRIPSSADGSESVVELRQVGELSDFGDALTPELLEAEQRLAAQVAAQNAQR